MKARTELRSVPVVMISLGVFTFLEIGYFTPTYLKFRAMQWEKVFQTPEMHEHFMDGLTAIIFMAFPGLAGLLTVGGVIILKHCKKIQNDTTVT